MLLMCSPRTCFLQDLCLVPRPQHRVLLPLVLLRTLLDATCTGGSGCAGTEACVVKVLGRLHGPQPSMLNDCSQKPTQGYEHQAHGSTSRYNI
jgi:hypothetical protein